MALLACGLAVVFLLLAVLPVALYQYFASSTPELLSGFASAAWSAYLSPLTTIRVRAVPGGSEAEVTYTHTSLGPLGDRFVAEFTGERYAQFMKTWEAQMNRFLRHGSALRTD